MALWKAGRGAQVRRLGGAIGGASDRFEAQVIRRRNPLKSLSQAFRTLLEPPSNLSEAPLKPSEALLKPPPSRLEALFTLKPPSSPSQALLKPLKPF